MARQWLGFQAMHEFTSISVSSYDAASLADKLSEKAAAGWDVVAIVPAGTNITAYLRRDAEPAEPEISWDTGSDAETAAVVDEVDETPSIADSSAAITAAAYVAEEVEEPEPVWEPEPVAEEPAPTEEPAGWAVAPEPANAALTSVGADEVAATPEPTPYVDTSAGYATTEPAPVGESGYVGEALVGGATAGYDTGTSSGVTTEPSGGYEAAAPTEPSSTYETAAPSRTEQHLRDCRASRTGQYLRDCRSDRTEQHLRNRGSSRRGDRLQRRSHN